MINSTAYPSSSFELTVYLSKVIFDELIRVSENVVEVSLNAVNAFTFPPD